jgi:hypothetical protein
MGESEPGTQMGPGFKQAPEVADCFGKGIRADSTLLRQDARFVEFEGLLPASSVVEQEDIHRHSPDRG